jgi:hypothetical protein
MRFWTVPRILALAILTFMAMVFLMPPGTHGEHAPRTACLSNIKQLSVGMAIYSADHDDLFALRDSWMDSILPYTKNDSLNRSFDLPQGTPGFGYAMNSTLHSRHADTVDDPSRHPLLYDSINFARNASDPFRRLPRDGRHKRSGSGLVHVAHADTSAKAVAFSDLKAKYPNHYRQPGGE